MTNTFKPQSENNKAPYMAPKLLALGSIQDFVLGSAPDGAEDDEGSPTPFVS